MKLYVGLGATDVTKPSKFIGLGDIHGPNPMNFIGLRWAFILQTPVSTCSAHGAVLSAASRAECRNRRGESGGQRVEREQSRAESLEY